MPLPEGKKPLSNTWFIENALSALPKITRVEVIDGAGRSYSKLNVKDVELSFQDDERTLKIFLKDTDET